MRRSGILLALVVVGLVLQPDAVLAWVRVPRDSPIIIRHRVQQPGSFDPSRSSTPQTPPLGVIRRPAPPPAIGVDPGYRPLWVPGTDIWNGFESVWVPGHWVGE